MSKRLIRSDEFGPYILTNGAAYRPQDVAAKELLPRTPNGGPAVLTQVPVGDWTGEPTKLETGTRVEAHHLRGSQLATVGGETWLSIDHDPRTVEYHTKFGG